MDKKTNNINWPEIMSKFAEHKGRIIDFCKDNNINHHQLYHQRKKLKKIVSSRKAHRVAYLLDLFYQRRFQK